MTVWFCFIAAFCLIAVVAVADATWKRGGSSWLGIVAGTLAALPGVALGLLAFAGVRLGKRLSKADADQIVEHVKSAFAEMSSNNTFDRTAGSHSLAAAGQRKRYAYVRRYLI